MSQPGRATASARGSGVPALPIIGWLRNYQRADLGADLVAGLTTAVMLVPQAMGYALLAGLPPIHGLYASVAPLLLYAVLGTSRQLAVGPVAMDSILVAGSVATIAAVGTDDYILVAAALGVMVGVIQAGLGFLRAGFLVNFLSRPVVAGFTAAAALIIAASQLGHLLGVPLPRTHHVHKVVWEALANASSWSWPTLAIGVSSIAALVLFKKRWPRLPAALFVVIAATVCVWAFGLSARGVSVVGEVEVEGLVPSRDYSKAHGEWGRIGELEQEDSLLIGRGLKIHPLCGRQHRGAGDGLLAHLVDKAAAKFRG